MKMLYILAAMMFAGLFMMTIASYKVLDAAKQVQAQQPAPGSKAFPSAAGTGDSPGNSEMLPYVTLSYLGLTLFIVGGLGAILYAFKAMNHRF